MGNKGPKAYPLHRAAHQNPEARTRNRSGLELWGSAGHGGLGFYLYTLDHNVLCIGVMWIV